MKKRIEEIFAENLRAARRARGLTQRELATLLNYSEKSVSKWESGAAIPPSALLPSLADLLACRIDDLLCAGDAPTYYLGIDGGGTKTEFLLTNAEGERISACTLGASNPIDVGIEECRRVLDAGIAEVTRGLPLRRVSAFAGIAGGISGDNRERIRAILAGYGFGKCDNGSDAQSAVAVALGERDGITLIAGTGSIVFARHGGELYRFGGFGYLLEEGGSGFSIGRDGILAALHAEENGTMQTPLYFAVQNMTECPTVLSAIGKLYEGGKRTFAEYAPAVFSAAAEGDGVAKAILLRNAGALAALIRSADRLFSEEERDVVMVGGLTRYRDVYLPMIEAELPRDGRYRLNVSTESPVWGALRLAGLTGGER
jgi:N-acetylglucosamine kinase-like BadF-type ATPase/DNA-binding XRE family transcriptional regulator